MTLAVIHGFGGVDYIDFLIDLGEAGKYSWYPLVELHPLDWVGTDPCPDGDRVQPVRGGWWLLFCQVPAQDPEEGALLHSQSHHAMHHAVSCHAFRPVFALQFRLNRFFTASDDQLIFFKSKLNNLWFTMGGNRFQKYKYSFQESSKTKNRTNAKKVSSRFYTQCYEKIGIRRIQTILSLSVITFYKTSHFILFVRNRRLLLLNLNPGRNHEPWAWNHEPLCSRVWSTCFCMWRKPGFPSHAKTSWSYSGP